MVNINHSRRKFMRTAGTAALAFPMINVASFTVFAASQKKYSAKVIDLVNENHVIDMLSTPFPLGPLWLSVEAENPKQNDIFKITDEYLQKVLSSGIDIFHPAMAISADSVMPLIARLNGLVGDHPNHIRRIGSVADFDDLKKGFRVGIILGAQNSDHFHEVDDVDQYYHLGQRISQLTYNSRNLIGTGSTDRIDGGLSNYGVEIIERMNKVGMAVDVSHCGDRTTLDAIEISKKPVLITHSNVRKLSGGHIRCKTDDVIKKMGETGSVMGISAVRQFISDKEPTGIEQLIDHIDYVSKLAGIEHVGIGSDIDMDGYDDMPEKAKRILKSVYRSSYKFREKLDVDDFNHPKRTFDLVDGLIRRGYSDDNIRNILGDNYKRVLKSIWTS